MKTAEMRALAADVNTNRLASKHPALRHTARLCESTHDQPNLRGDGGEWLDPMPFPAHLSARVASISYDLNHDEMGAGKAR
jgi:hypothetical protein